MDKKEADELSESESISDDNYHDSIEVKNDNNDDDHSDDEEIEMKNRLRTDLVLDLRNVPSISDTVKSDDDDETRCEKLSAVMEQPEDELRLTDAAYNETESREDTNKILVERINTLGDVMRDLREKLRQELILWRKERDEFQLLREQNDIRALEEATAAARAAADAYAAESPLSNELGTVDLNPVQSLSELTILEYEKKLAKYQDALALAQAEKRYNMRRRSIANTYRRRLIEVERLCNEELENIRQSADTLQPLRKMISQWCINDNEKNHGDHETRELNSLSSPAEKSSQRNVVEVDANNYDYEGNNILPEFVTARFSYAESFANRETQSSIRDNTKVSMCRTLIESNSLPSNWHGSNSNC